SLGQTVGTAPLFTNGTYITGLTQCFFQATNYNMTGAASYSWYKVTLQTPFLYDPSLSLVFELKNSSSGGTYVGHSSGTTGVRIYGVYNNATGNVSSGLVDFGFDLIPPTRCAGIPNSGNIVLDDGD